MIEPTYAVVSYLAGSLGDWVDKLRHRFDPRLASWLAHVSLLPPRTLEHPLDEAVELLQRKCALIEPFEISIGRVSTFWPTSGVVYLSIAQGHDRLTQLHDSLNCGPLASSEPHSYVPHITIAQDIDEQRLQRVLGDVDQEWSQYHERATFLIESFFLVQKTPDNQWVNLVPIRLGGLVTKSR